MSTPQLSLKSHSLRELLMRLMTRGTPNSCLESQLITRLSSSSPVAAMTTSTAAEVGRGEVGVFARVGRHQR